MTNGLAGRSVTLETNGSLPIDEHLLEGVMVSMDWKLPSSGADGEMRAENLSLLRPSDQLKFVVSDEEDLDAVAGVFREHEVAAPAVVQPVGGRNLEWLVDAVLERGLTLRVMPQLHKIIWGEERGV